MDSLAMAIDELVNRRIGHTIPDGRLDNAGRWYPTVFERKECCDHIRRPTRRFPWSLRDHCKTVKHVARLFEVDPVELRREARFVQVLAE